MRQRKCQKRLPDFYVEGHRYSLLCQLPEGHGGDCDPDAQVLIKQVVPEIDKRYPHAATIDWLRFL